MKGTWFSNNMYYKGTKTCLQSGKSLLRKMRGNELVKRKNKRRVFWEERTYVKVQGQNLHLRNWKRAWVPEAQEKSGWCKMTDMLKWNQKNMLKTSKQDCIKPLILYFSGNEKRKMILNGRTHLPISKITLVSEWSMDLVREAKVREKTH